LPEPKARSASAQSVLVLGAGSAVSEFLLARLTAADLHPVSAGGRAAAPLPRAPSAIALLPVDGLITRLTELQRAGVRRLIAFSTTSVFYKTGSQDEAERRRIQAIARAERVLASVCDAQGMAWTLFRPTMVYGSGRDANVAAIARFVRRWRFFPLVAGGLALRQPVHADDLAAACVQALAEPRTHGLSYTLSGGEALTYREMVARVFRQLGRTPHFVPVPAVALRAGVRAVRWLPNLRDLSPDLATRMALDLAFGHAPAARDFGYRPRPFQLDARAVGAH
jgi:nucleoside-diphosphate-sugar epimerase